MIALGIDVGTTHTKALALDVGSGRTVAVESAPTPMRSDSEGDAHQAADVLGTVVDLIARVVDRLDAPDAVGALCVASVGEEVVLLDRVGRPVGDTIAWYDPRGLEQAQAFMAGPGGETGLSRRWPPDPTFSIFKLMWTRDQRAAEYAAATTWTDLGDYVLSGLGGDLVMDQTHASRAGAFDLVARAWDQPTIDAAGLAIGFPRLVPSMTVTGSLAPSIARRTGLRPGVSIVAGGHDHLCAAYGAGLRSGAELFLSAGTSEAHLALIGAPLEGEAAGRVDQGCYVDAGRYYAHINIHSGHFFRQWRQLLYSGVDEDDMYGELESVPEGSAGVRFELTGDLRRSHLREVPYDAERQTIMRAVLEGLARRSAAIVDELEAASGRPYDLVLAAGHPTRVALWRRLRMAAYGRTMAAVDEPESTAFGAAVMAAQAVDAAGAEMLVARRVAWSDESEAGGSRSDRGWR